MDEESPDPFPTTAFPIALVSGIPFMGSWQEPVSVRLALPFTPASLVQVLRFGTSPESSPYCHQDIAHWCERFWKQYADIDAPPEIERLMPVLADVETQWDLFLANTYSRFLSCNPWTSRLSACQQIGFMTGCTKLRTDPSLHLTSVSRLRHLPYAGKLQH